MFCNFTYFYNNQQSVFIINYYLKSSTYRQDQTSFNDLLTDRDDNIILYLNGIGTEERPRVRCGTVEWTRTKTNEIRCSRRAMKKMF